MGWLTQLDSSIQECLTGARIEGKAALRTVGPLRATMRSAMAEALLAAERPAMFYAIRRVGDAGGGVLAEVQAVLIAEGLGGREAAWRGDGRTAGAYELAEAAARGLASLPLAGAAGVWLRQQELAHVDGRVVAFSQAYDVRQAGERVLVDGRAIVESPSVVRLVRAEGKARWATAPVAGTSRQWASWQGRDAGAATFEGTLWAGDEASLREMEAGLEALLNDRRLRHLTTESGGSWEDAALVSWQRTAGRAAQPMLGLVGQSVRIEFGQYRQ